jgi:hypothetical protein
MKNSFRDLLGFQPLTPHYDELPEVDEKAYTKAVAPVPDQGSPNTAHKRLAVYDGEYEKGLDKAAYRISQLNTGLQTFVAALPNVNDFDSAAIANVLGDVGNSFNFLNYTRRKYANMANTKPTISEMMADSRTLRANANRIISDINDPMGKYRTDPAPNPAHTSRDYVNPNPNSTRSFGKMSETMVNATGRAIQEALGAISVPVNNGTKIYQRSAKDHPLLTVDPTLVGEWFYEFKEKYQSKNPNEGIKFKESCPTIDYYQYISTAYDGMQKKSSPQEMLAFAVDHLGFSSGYKDWQNFSPGSSHMWGMTIEPYVSPSGMAISRAPNLPVVQVPIWTTDGDGRLQCVFKKYDYGKMPPVVSYSFEVGSLRGSTVPIFDGSFNMPLGFEFENKITLSFIDDEYHSMQKYMAMFINTIYRPSIGLMAPYDLCTWLVTLTAFRPGMGVNYSFQLICVPHSYTMSYQGTEQPGIETMQITLSIVGMKQPDNTGATVVPGGKAAKSTWNLVNWNDVTVIPRNNTALTDFDSEEHSWGERKDFSKYNQAYDARQRQLKAERERLEAARKRAEQEAERKQKEEEARKAAEKAQKEADERARMQKNMNRLNEMESRYPVLTKDVNPDILEWQAQKDEKFRQSMDEYMRYGRVLVNNGGW